MKIAEYRVVCCKNDSIGYCVYMFNKKINEMLQEGWEPYGPPTIIYQKEINLLQTMVKYAEE